MRTTIDLPDDLHDIVRSMAIHTRRSLSQTTADLIRRGLSGPAWPSAVQGRPVFEADPLTGLPVLHVAGGVITPDDVKALDDD